MSNDIEVDETRQTVSNGVVLKAKMKRGTGTRDQDTVTGKIKRPTVDEVEEDRSELVESMDKAMNDMREVQPDDE